MKSEQTGDLAKALALAQAVIKPPTKGRTAKIESSKGGYSYKYADLSDVIECYREPLSKHDLAVTQTMSAPNGHIVLTTTLLHGSGQWIDSEYPISLYERPQEQGSAITYARRYAVTALLGIAAEEDDDGAAAQDGTKVDRREEPPDPNSDDAVILTIAQEIGLITGQHPEDVIKAFSAFMGTDKKTGKPQEVFFKDPRKEKSAKWKKGVREKLERELHKVGAADAVGAEAPPF